MKVYLIYNFHFFNISAAEPEPEEPGKLADLRSDPSQPADITTRNIFSIILDVDIIRLRIFYFTYNFDKHGIYSAH